MENELPVLHAWKFYVVQDDHPDGIVEFSYAIDNEVSALLRNRVKFAWATLLEEVDDTARQETEDALS